MQSTSPSHLSGETYDGGPRIPGKGHRQTLHYYHHKPLLLQTDASQYGLEAMISHKMPDGTEKQITIASRTMTDPEKNACSTRKKHFQNLQTEEISQIPPWATIQDSDWSSATFLPVWRPEADQYHGFSRVTHWHMSHSRYQYTIVHKCSKDHLNTDML